MFTRPTPLSDDISYKEVINNIPVVQIDYYTGEIIGEYDSIREASFDNDVTINSIVSALKKSLKTGYLHSKELRFMTVDDYDSMLKTRGF